MSPRDFRLYSAVLLLPLLATITHASSGTEGASFLDIPVGAEPAAMGSAYTALATNAYAPLWNPGALGFITDSEFSGQHLSYLDSMNYESLSYVQPLPKKWGLSYRTVGAAVQYLSSGDMTARDHSNQLLGTFSSHYAAYTLAYGQLLTEQLSLGLSGKWINAAIDNVSANAYALDAGATYLPRDKWSLAATVTNIGTRLTFLQQSDSLPMAAHLATAYEPSRHWLLSAEGVYPKTGLAGARLGVQWTPIELIALRAGYRTETVRGLSPMAGLTTGIGVSVWGSELSFAYLPYGDLGATEYISLLIRFGGRRRALRNLIRYHSRNTIAPQGDNDDPEFKQLIQLLSQPVNPVASVPGRGQP